MACSSSSVPLSPTQSLTQNSANSLSGQISPQASAFALESAFSKVASLLPQFWGKGNSRPSAITHDETLETSFSTETPENTRGDAHHHLEVSKHLKPSAPEHSPPPPFPLPLPTPAQSAEPPTVSAPDARQDRSARMEVSQKKTTSRWRWAPPRWFFQ